MQQHYKQLSEINKGKAKRGGNCNGTAPELGWGSMKQINFRELTKSTDMQMRNKNMMRIINTEFREMGKLKQKTIFVI